MRNLLVLLLALLPTTTTYAQSAYQLLRAGKAHATIIRTLRAPAVNSLLAKELVLSRTPIQVNTKNIVTKYSTNIGIVEVPEISIVAKFVVPRINEPANIWGSYKYLRVLSRHARANISLLSDKYQKEWKRINTTTEYNGVHHIIPKNITEMLYSDAKNRAITEGRPFYVTLSDMQNDTPAVFHPLHGNPAYTKLFHNFEEQIALYVEGGVYAIIMNYFSNVQAVHWLDPKQPYITAEVVQGTLKEAELWCNTYGIVFKK